uniref:Uncharacterized protein n=1 Tax=Aegilops tauschii subsp. strangulata TaxID=200361 RepID=A0A453IN76_AEGTS
VPSNEDNTVYEFIVYHCVVCYCDPLLHFGERDCLWMQLEIALLILFCFPPEGNLLCNNVDQLCQKSSSFDS